MDKNLGQLAICAVAVAVLCLGGCAKKQAARTWDADVKAESGPVEVHVKVEKKTITLAETFKVQLKAAAKEGYEVTMPPAQQMLKDGLYGLRDWRDMGKKLDAQNRVVRTVEVELDPFVSGEPNVPELVFAFHKISSDPNEAAKQYSVSTQPVDLKVDSLPSDPNSGPDIADIEPVMDMPGRFGGIWWWLGGGTVLAVAAVVAWLFLRRKRSQSVVRAMISAHELAYQRMRELVAEDLVGQGRIKEFYERISNILRHYIEDRFDLRAPERTTEEFLFELQSSGSLETADKNRLKEFMTHCDLVKFAKHQPQTEDIQRTFDLVKDFIEKTRSDVRMVEQPEQALPAGEVA